MTARKIRHLRILSGAGVTVAILALISGAIGGTEPDIAILVVSSVAALAILFQVILPGSAFFNIVFANLISVYACLFVFFTEVNLNKVSDEVSQIGFLLPLAGFLFGVFWRRKTIARVVADEHDRIGSDFRRALMWMTPLVLVGIATFLLPLDSMDENQHDVVLLTGMTVIALTALLASRDIAVFILDTGVLFEGFFGDIVRLSKPAFAFLSFYSLVVIVFGCIYTIVGRYGEAAAFSVAGEARPITFAEGLYFSIVTLSTLGYGDITPLAPVVRVLVAGQIICGILLLLFGFHAILGVGRHRSG